MKSKPTVILSVLFAGMVADGMLLAGPEGTATEAKPALITVAVISGEDTGLSDVFFTVLADSENLTLVERSDLRKLMQEVELSSMAGFPGKQCGGHEAMKRMVIPLMRERVAKIAPGPESNQGGGNAVNVNQH